MSLATLLVIVVPLAVIVTIAAVPALRGSLRGALSQRAFVGAALLLGVAAVGLNAATESMRLHFRKQPVSLSVSRLDDAKQGIPVRVGHWVQVSKDEPLDHATQEVLGTKDYVFRDYVDSRVVSPEDIAWFADKSTIERSKRLFQIESSRPDAVIKLAITYYTGLVDTVPHVPEKCYVADGFEPVSPETRQQTLGVLADGSPRQVSYRYIHFQDATGGGRVDRNVAYFFHVNGRYESSSIGVRTQLQNLFQRYGYFAKIEVMTTAHNQSDPSPEAKSEAQLKSLAAFNDLLTAALPEVERCLPDWKKVTAQK